MNDEPRAVTKIVRLRPALRSSKCGRKVCGGLIQLDELIGQPIPRQPFWHKDCIDVEAEERGWVVVEPGEDPPPDVVLVDDDQEAAHLFDAIPVGQVQIGGGNHLLIDRAQHGLTLGLEIAGARDTAAKVTSPISSAELRAVHFLIGQLIDAEGGRSADAA